jgi:[ribosomal protein S5]-alanine N-acetyltransferase
MAVANREQHAVTELRLVAILKGGELAEPVELPSAVTEILPATATMYGATGFVPPWIGYVAVSGGEAVGTCAFKTAPANGRIEIAYFTFPGFEGRGIATAMAQALISLARAEQPGLTVAAQTLPGRNASNRILERLGFRRAGTAIDAEAGEVWEWQLA